MKANLISVATLVIAASALSACQTGADDDAGPGVCRPDAAETLVGMDRLTDGQAMQMTGATIVRNVVPGQGVTMDYRQERVTIETDPRTGKIVRAGCG